MTTDLFAINGGRGALLSADGRYRYRLWRLWDDLQEALAEACDVPSTSGGYKNNLGSLRSLGLVDYPRPGQVAAQRVLFLEER